MKLIDQCNAGLRLNTITALTGGASSALDSIVTVGRAVGTIISFALSGGAQVSFRLKAGTDAANSPLIIRPVDYNGSTNSKVWELLTFEAASYKVGGNQVLGARITGWGTPTGTATRTTFATSTVTLEQLAERVKALIDDDMTHGFIGT